MVKKKFKGGKEEEIAVENNENFDLETTEDENIEEVDLAEEVDLVEEKKSEVNISNFKLEDKPKKTEPMVRVKPKKDYSCYIGDQWWRFKKGVQATVPQSVKDRLIKLSILDPL